MRFVTNFILSLCFAVCALSVAGFAPGCGVASNISQELGIDQLIDNFEELAKKIGDRGSNIIADVLDEFLTEDEKNRVMSSTPEDSYSTLYNRLEELRNSDPVRYQRLSDTIDNLLLQY